MRKIRIFNAEHTLEAEILPDFGAMISDIRWCGKRVLWFDAEMLGLGNVLAGGIPVLFPFAGKTSGDTMRVQGVDYCMPMHGFIKDCPFDLEYAADDEARFIFKSDERIHKLIYPFPFALRITYRIQGNSLTTVAEVMNHGRTDMPLAMGYHPYFYTSDKTDTCLSFSGGAYDDYVCCGLNGDPVRGVLKGEAKVADDYDHVFFDSGNADFSFANSKDGYCLQLNTDDTFKVLTLSTRHKDSVCIEPWQGIPNAANNSEACFAIRAGAGRKFSYNIYFSDIL